MQPPPASRWRGPRPPGRAGPGPAGRPAPPAPRPPRPPPTSARRDAIAGRGPDGPRGRWGRRPGRSPAPSGRDGGGGAGELVPPGLGEVDGLPQPVPELGVLGLERPETTEQLLSRRSAVMLGQDGVLDLAGVVVDSLPAAQGVARPQGDVPPGPGEDGGGIGDPGRQGYGEHRGGLSRSWDGCAIPRPGAHPSPFQEVRG